ncbi:MAG: isoaspartyl peptidase/L-asparaginase [Saprospiraceae bacterium]|nr:isoaspartyl peptidase/L-asparaginase [Saprospiraceae bacterium]
MFFTVPSCSEKDKNATLESDLDRPSFALVIHGGAGSVHPDRMSEEREKVYTDALNRVLDEGERILSEGGSSLDAVEAVLKLMEDDSLFNAGRGSVFTYEGTNELDASIMDGNTMNAGAVAGVSRIKNPISAARAVMESSEHVLLAGQGAERFARDHGLEMVDPEYLKTQSKWRRLKAVQKSLREDSYISENGGDEKFGTVGAVALDEDGHIAAGTTTGGMTNKRWNRIGDSPIIGAGTYADDKVGGVSCTGHGEFYIRYSVAYDLIAKMKYAGLPLKTAAETIIHEELVEAGGSGGLIALDRQGNIAMEFNTSGMFRGYARPGEREVAMFR